MAGGAKETPRQKMIGMMYLVLTALLALQVSNAVLDKFLFIDESLQQAKNATRTQNDARMQAIQAQVEKKGNKDVDVAVLNKAEQVFAQTSDMLKYIQGFRDKVIEVSGGQDPETKEYKGAKDYDKQMAWTIGPEGSKSGEAYTLQTKLNGFVSELNTIVSSVSDSVDFELQPLALDAKDIEAYKNDPDKKGKSFAELNFGNTPTVACLAILSDYESRVAQAEAKALEVLANEVGATELRFDKIMAVVSPESRVVAAGTKYKAEMFIAASSSSAKPTMTYNGRPVEVVDGKGQIEFTANASSYDKENKSTQTWKGTITISTPRGDTTFEIEEEFEVAKPVVQVQSGSVSALYLNCGNVLQINVPALGTAYEPSFTASGAQVIQGAKKGMVTVVPNKGQVNLNVFSSGNKLSTEKFKVKPVPKPTIAIKSRGKKVDLKNGVTLSGFPRSLTADAIPDESFASFLPNDARYRVFQWEVTLARGRRAIGGTKRVSGPDVNLTDLAAKAQAGDRIVIEIKEVRRLNFKDQQEKVAGVNDIFTIPIN